MSIFLYILFPHGLDSAWYIDKIAMNKFTANLQESSKDFWKA